MKNEPAKGPNEGPALTTTPRSASALTSPDELVSIRAPVFDDDEAGSRELAWLCGAPEWVQTAVRILACIDTEALKE